MKPIIRLTQYTAMLPRKGNASNTEAGPRERCRWRAEFLTADGVQSLVEGCLDRDEAIGAVVRDVALGCASPEEAIDLVTGLFGDTAHRSIEVTLGRAIRFSLHHRRGRKHPGAVVEIRELPLCKRSPVLAGKGGAN